MSFIITADQRMAQKSAIKACILGPSGIGKTSLARTLPEDKTLFIDAEAGMLSLEGWGGDSINVRKAASEMGVDAWSFCKTLACWIAGPNPSARQDEAYSHKHYEYAKQMLGDPSALAKYEHIFVDSITVAGRFSFHWCKGQPEAFSEKTGKPDNRGAYGLHGKEMIDWITQLQHTPEKNVILLGILDEKVDDYNRRTFEAQIDGSKVGREMPGIFDQVISMVQLDTYNGQPCEPYRAFVTQTLNKWGYPAKDRSGRLDLIERPDLGYVLGKLKAGSRVGEHTTDLPVPQAEEAPTQETA